MITSNKEIKNIKKIVKSPTIKIKAKEQKVWFLRLLLATLASGLLGKLSKDKGVIWDSEGTIKAFRDF